MKLQLLLFFGVLCLIRVHANSQDILGCGGFIKSEVEINFSVIEVKLYTKQGSLKYQTDCAPNNGYYMVPVYDKGEYVLKVEPPPGWTFEPQSIELTIDGKTDKCSIGEDINFVFTGFGVIGKVISRGQSSGPEGVTLVLKKAGTEQMIQKTLSTAGGNFVFAKVLPGDYVIEASREPWLFDVSSIPVRVDRETGNAGSALIVSGYDVQGRVFSDGEPVPGVNFVLFALQTMPEPIVSGCDSSPLKDGPVLNDHTFLCRISSGADGLFHFPSVPCGQYVLVPFYKGEYIKFDVVPNQMSLAVSHKSVIIQEPFSVAGFSVSGRVLSSPKGQGISGAKIIIDGRLQAVTQDGGLYHLDSMKSGTYQVTVEAPRMAFDITPIKVTPNTPQLPDIIAARFQVCGSIELQPTAIQSRTVEVTSGELSQTATALADGTFCIDFKPGAHRLSVKLNDVDARTGVRLTPSHVEVTVVDKPVDGIQFTQYQATVSGTVHCLEPTCGSLPVIMESINRPDDQKTVRTIESGQLSKFTFQGIVPGKYRVTVVNDQWCWKAKSMEIEVIDQDLAGVDFTQTGFILTASLSHGIKLEFTRESKPEIVGSAEVVGSFNLTKGVNKFCLSHPGVYQLTPISCHQFEQQQFTYDTSAPTVLSLVAVHHLVGGVITVPQLSPDIKVTIRSADGETALGPLTMDQETAGVGEQEKLFVYKFSYLAKGGEKLAISATSSLLLFYPPVIEITVASDECMGVAATFEGRLGLFITGQIQPALDDVLITVSSKDGTKISEILTDAAGQYRVGPIDSSVEYSVTAEKEGFIFTAIEGQPLGHFRSFKLGRIHVKVSDGSALLPGVLLSLSGGSNYRKNNVTQEGGVMDFTNLSPGEYYLRVMMKEYQFEPASQMVRVGEGDTVEIDVAGRRIEYSCYGTVLSLSGEAESGVYIEAVTASESPSCRSLQEESKAENDGSFRIRGLQPGCEYVIRLKSGDANTHIERSTPRSKHIQVVNDDVTGVNIIAFRRLSQMDISGNIVSNSTADFISTLKVHLYKELSQDSPVHSVSLGPTSFFYLPSVPINNQSYLLKLTSTLSHTTFDYSLPEIRFSANVPHRHFTLKFEPQRKSVEQELAHSSFIMFPLGLILLFLIYNHQKLVPWLKEYASSVQLIISRTQSQPANQSYRQTPTSDTASNIDLLSADIVKKKPKARKI